MEAPFDGLPVTLCMLIYACAVLIIVDKILKCRILALSCRYSMWKNTDSRAQACYFRLFENASGRHVFHHAVEKIQLQLTAFRLLSHYDSKMPRRNIDP